MRSVWKRRCTFFLGVFSSDFARDSVYIVDGFTLDLLSDFQLVFEFFEAALWTVLQEVECLEVRRDVTLLDLVVDIVKPGIASIVNQLASV